MGAVKNHFHDEISARELPEEPNVCGHCGNDVCVEDDACRACWHEINGQFGVGA